MTATVCGNCGGAGVEYRRADDEPDHDPAWLPCAGCQHDQYPPAKPAAFGVVNVNHDGQEWTISYERPATGSGPDYRLTTWCVEPGHPAWLETLNVYGVGEAVDPVSEAIAWAERLAAEGTRPWEG
jgi:hypothetical protein